MGSLALFGAICAILLLSRIYDKKINIVLIEGRAMQNKIKWALCIYIAFVFLQSLFFKFSNSLETQHIFGILGDWSGLAWFGQYGGYMVGIAELVAVILLFIPVLHALGALMSLGIISGAIFFHLFTPLGIAQPVFDGAGQVVDNDGGILFIMACGIFIAAIALLVIDSNSPASLYKKLFKR